MFVKVNKVLRPDFVLIVFHHLFFTCFFDVDFKGLLGVDLLGLLGVRRQASTCTSNLIEIKILFHM